MYIKSPGGSTFPYYYKGGEIHALKYGSYFKDSTRLLGLMDAEEQFIQQRPAQKLRIWVDFYETELSEGIIARLAAHVTALDSQIIKLAIVGCSARDEKKILKALNKANGVGGKPVCFFDDPEDAKTWLVS